MILKKDIVGKHIGLRTAQPEDAEFVLSLRLNPELSRYLKPVDPSVEKQRKWIESKKKAPDDYHMIIESHQGKRYGVVAIYDIKEERFEWGRWIISRSAPHYVALESMILVYHFTFSVLGLEYTKFEVRKGNDRVIDYHKAYGANITGQDDTYLYFSYTKEQFTNNEKFRYLIDKWNLKE